jgi:hypothetical protein
MPPDQSLENWPQDCGPKTVSAEAGLILATDAFAQLEQYCEIRLPQHQFFPRDLGVSFVRAFWLALNRTA